MILLPEDIQRRWGASLRPARDNGGGVVELVKVRPTKPGTNEEMRLIVTLIDEDEKPVMGVPVAFAYDTAEHHIFVGPWSWAPPLRQYDEVVTNGAGTVEHIQGSVVKDGQPGGITVFILDPHFPSDVVSGVGALSDHTGLHLVFKYKRNGVQPLRELVANLAERLDQLEKGE